jgi:hypothetical protein
MVMHKATSSGWAEVALGYEVIFANANVSVGQGDTLTQGAVTATINRVVVETGTLLSGTNTGRLIISAPAGGNVSAGAATSTGGGSVTLSGAEAAITLLPNGRIDSLQGNFTGSLSTLRLYGCDGVNRAFEFDGTTYVPIETKSSPDAPKHIAIHKNHLFVAQGSSVLHSGTGDPYNFSITAGAGEIAVGDEVTDFSNQPGGTANDAIAIYSKNNTLILYGNGSGDWNLTTFNRGNGAVHYTAQNLAQTFVLDERGVFTLQSSQNYGNFDSSTLTAQIRPFILDKNGRAIGSCVNREKSQYRVFFNDGYGLYLTIVNGKFMGSMPVYFLNPVTCVVEDEANTGSEVTYFGSSNGFVYKLDSGTSFDGQPIEARIKLNYAMAKSPRIIKRYRKCGLEVTGESYAEIAFSYSIGYGTAEKEQPGIAIYGTPFAVPYWDIDSWDLFVWDGSTLLPSECEMTGSAENVALTFSSLVDYAEPFTINTAIIHYSFRRGVR